MTKNFLHISWTIFFLAGSSIAFSQSAISVKATVDRKSILIGEPIQLVLEVQIPLGADRTWFFTDSIPHFEYIDRGKIDSTMTSEGKTYSQHLVITSFDSGSWEIPALSILVNDVKYVTDSIPINVDFSKFDPTKDYHDIKDILEVQNPYVRYVSWILAGITAICFLLFLFFLTRKKKVQQMMHIPVSRISPYEEAKLALEALQKRRLPQTGQVKVFYMELNDILRVFVYRKLQIASMERTNEELILQFRQLKLSNEEFSRLAQAMRIIDFVKFAKYLPSEKDDQENFDIIRSSVELLNTIDK